MIEPIKSYSLDELRQLFLQWQEPRFRADQVFSWIYKKGVLEFEAMSNIPSSLKERLKKHFISCQVNVKDVLTSVDKTQKLLFELLDGHLIEAVVIPAENRVTACVSSQVGCKYKCSFCASGLGGFKRNLSVSEILDEVWFLKDASSDHLLTHLVFMGTGEPFDNYDNVLKAIRIINAEYGFNIGARRITISTAGVIPGIERLSKEGLQIELSVSLHAADDALRSKLMPINKKYPLKDLIAACHQYVAATNRQVTFEYILIKDVNSGMQNAVKLSTLLQGLNAKVNIIPCNTIKELALNAPSPRDISLFKQKLVALGAHATIRKSRGEDIHSACGQLRMQYGT